MELWRTIYRGHVGTRHITVERNRGAAFRARTTLPGSGQKVQIGAKTLNQLQERLVGFSVLTEAQAAEIAQKITFH